MSFDYQEYLASREWALLKEAVRERSNNTCEHCGRRPMEATHHTTYARAGQENLDDLMAVCNPCHLFLSGKSSIDPLTDGVRIYLAGKIRNWEDDWRHSIFQHSFLPNRYESSWVETLLYENAFRTHEFPISKNALQGGFDCTGPYFAGKHSNAEMVGSPHGLEVRTGNDHDPCDAQRVTELCRNAINQSHWVFAWIASGDAYGTLFELGYAAAKGKRLFVSFASEALRQAMWFAANLAFDCAVSPTPAEAWQEFRTCYAKSHGAT